MPQPSKVSFAEDFNLLAALITHLSLTKWKNRTPAEIAGSLAMDRDEVERVLLAYPGFFRESSNRKKDTGERLFTIHMRYALRRKDLEQGINRYEPLESEHISIMLKLLTEMIVVERQDANLAADILQRSRALKWTTFVALAVAILSSLTALVVALLGSVA